MSLNNNMKYQSNILIKVIIAMFIVNIILMFCMILQNVMFYKANFGTINQTVTQNVNIDTRPHIDKININNCSFEALDTLRGIGEKKANLIISNRPYKDIYELRKVIGDTTFNNIKDFIST